MNEICYRCIVCHSKQNIKRCSECKIVNYCSKKCQKLDWYRQHSDLCFNNNNNNNKMISDIASFEINSIKLPKPKDEDRFVIKTNSIDVRSDLGEFAFAKVEEFENMFSAAIYDGHGGRQVSEFLNNKKLNVFFEEELKISMTKENNNVIMKKTEKLKLQSQAQLPQSQQNQNKREKEQLDFNIKNNSDIEKLFLQWDNEIRQEGIGKAGSTATILLVDNKKIKIAYVGDSRAVLYHFEKKITLSTKDHKITDIAERRRVKQKGGMIILNNTLKIPHNLLYLNEKQSTTITNNTEIQKTINYFKEKSRFNERGEYEPGFVLRVTTPQAPQSLAMTRAFGDIPLKKNWNVKAVTKRNNYDPDGVVSVYPSIVEFEIPETENENIFILVASDGFWDYITENQQVIDIIDKYQHSVDLIQQNLKKLVVRQHDDTTILVAHLKTTIPTFNSSKEQ